MARILLYAGAHAFPGPVLVAGSTLHEEVFYYNCPASAILFVVCVIFSSVFTIVPISELLIHLTRNLLFISPA